jgi:predicted AlkP superfamily phosphohydrolase/phosphomutase
VSERLLIVGFDAADGDLALRWMREGKLPTLAGLAERGTVAPLRSLGEHLPESSWASLITGTTPGEHGIYNWRIVRPGTVDHTRMAAGGWVRPFWAVLRELSPDPKPKAAIFDIPYSGGLEDDDVIEMSGWGLRVTRQGSSWPPGLFEEIRARHGRHPDWLNRDYHRGPLSERRYRRVLRALTRRRTDVILDLLGRIDWGLAVVNFGEPHFAGHAFHHHLESVERPRWHARYAAPSGLLDLYQEADRNLARLLEAAAADADVMVVSTIGLRPNEASKELLGRIMVSLGYQVPAKSGSPDHRQAVAMRVGTRIVPRFLRHRLRRLVPVETAEGIADRAWGKSMDWSRSRAVSAAEAGSAWLRVNLQGREPEGIVPVAEHAGLLADITADLESLVDLDSGEPAVAEVIPVAEIAPGSFAGQMPDLMVRWAPGRRIRRVRHPRVGVIDDGGGPYARTEHNGRGFLVAAGPSIVAREPPGGAPLPRELDIAPTALHLFGCPVPTRMQGEVLGWLLADDRKPERVEADISAEPTF